MNFNSLLTIYWLNMLFMINMFRSYFWVSFMFYCTCTLLGPYPLCYVESEASLVQYEYVTLMQFELLSFYSIIHHEFSVLRVTKQNQIV